MNINLSLVGLFEIGVSDKQSLSEQKRIRLLNQIIFLAIGAILFRFVAGVIEGYRIIYLLTPIYLGIFFTAYYLQYKQQFVLARYWFIGCFTVFIIALQALMGRGFAGEFPFFTIVLMMATFFNTTLQKIAGFVLLLLAYGFTFWTSQHIEPLLEQHLTSHHYCTVFLLNLSVVFLISLLFTRENQRFEDDARVLLQKIEEKNKKLQAVNQELEKFAFIASHDLKTPLRNIHSFLGLIERKLPAEVQPEILEFLDFASLNAKRMHVLIEDILEYTRVEQKDLTLELIALDETLSLAMDHLQALINSRQAKIHIDSLPQVLGNKRELVTVFQNVLENGIKYNEASVPQLWIEVREKEYTYEVLISDNGIGIEEKFQTRVFEMFYRLHNQGRYKGTGIGLATCQKIMARHGGKIAILKSDQKGTCFCLVLPKTHSPINVASVAAACV